MHLRFVSLYLCSAHQASKTLPSRDRALKFSKLSHLHAQYLNFIAAVPKGSKPLSTFLPTSQSCDFHRSTPHAVPHYLNHWPRNVSHSNMKCPGRSDRYNTEIQSTGTRDRHWRWSFEDNDTQEPPLLISAKNVPRLRWLPTTPSRAVDERLLRWVTKRSSRLLRYLGSPINSPIPMLVGPWCLTCSAVRRHKLAFWQTR